MGFMALTVRRAQRFGRSRRHPPFAAATIAAAPVPPTLEQLPASLRNPTVILSAPNGVPVYVLGISHVSKAALVDIRALCEAVQPDIVLVEV